MADSNRPRFDCRLAHRSPRADRDRRGLCGLGYRNVVIHGRGSLLSGGNFDSRPITYEVRLVGGTETAKDLDKEWTLLMSSGAVHWANVVEGPTRVAPGETASLTLIFLFEPMPNEGEPVALRWDPGRKVYASFGLNGR